MRARYTHLTPALTHKHTHTRHTLTHMHTLRCARKVKVLQCTLTVLVARSVCASHNPLLRLEPHTFRALSYQLDCLLAWGRSNASVVIFSHVKPQRAYFYACDALKWWKIKLISTIYYKDGIKTKISSVDWCKRDINVVCQKKKKNTKRWKQHVFLSNLILLCNNSRSNFD